MKTLIIGANGQIGKKLVSECIDLGLDIRVMIRDESQMSYFTRLGVDAVVGDLEGDISHAFNSCEQVVFSAGSGSKSCPKKTLLVDLWGSIRAVEESEKQGIKHFIMVSSLKSCDPLRGPQPIRHYLVARNRADDRLINSTLNNTLLRPGRLLDTEGTGKITSNFDWNDIKNTNSTITRDDVVSTILAAIITPHRTNRTLDFIQGDVVIEDFMNDLLIGEVAV